MRREDKILASRMNFHEFFDEVLYLTDEKVFSNIYIDENIDFFKEFISFLHDQYEEDRITVVLAAGIVEKMMKLNFQYKPSHFNVLRDDYGNIED